MQQEEMTGVWQHFTFRFTPKAGAKLVVPYLMVNHGTGKVYFDDVSFVELNVEPEPEPVESMSENMLTNFGFELISGGKPVGWAHSPGQLGTDVGTSNTEAHSGTKSAFVDNSAGTGLFFWRTEEPLAVYSDTAEYELSAWVKVVDPAMTGQLTLNLDYLDQNSAWIGGSNVVMQQEAMTGDWQHFTYRFTPKAGTKLVVPYLMVNHGTGKVYFDDVSLVKIIPESAEGSYSIWTAPSTASLKRDTAPWTSTTVQLDMAKREDQSGQVLVTASGGNVKITEATLSDLSSGSSIIPASQVEVLVQHYIKTTAKSNSAHEPGWYPDALIPLAPYMSVHGAIRVASGNNQAIWFTVKTQENTPAGLYTGTISLTANGNVEQVPITVKVRDFALPEENHAQTAFNIWGSMLKYGYPGLVDGSPEYWDILKEHYEFLLNYHITPSDLPIPTDDYVQYITDAEPYIRDPRVSAYNLPYKIGDFESGAAKALVDGLKAQGLLDKAYYYLGTTEIDEPTADQFPLVKLRSQQIAAIDPDLRHIVTTGLHPELMNDVNTFAPLFREFETREYLQKAADFQANGGHIWWYGCVIPANPYPTYHLDDDLISARLVPWMQRSYNIEGNLYWSVNIYARYTGTSFKSRDIWNDPFAWPGANGDGYLLYPGAKYGMNSPIATLRLQTIRDGNQDYEYLWLLEEKMKEAANQLGIEVSPKELTQVYYDRLFTNVRVSTKDVEELQQVRSEVADFIEELNMDPQALVVFKDQLNEYSKKEAVVYAEKGTKVTINDVAINAEPIPGNGVADRYSYVMDFDLGLNEVTIKLKKGMHERTVTKKVLIKTRVIEPLIKKTIINNFPDQQSIQNIKTEHGVTLLGITDNHATGEGKALHIKTPVGSQYPYPGIRIPVKDELKDFTWADTIEVDIYNDSNEPKDIFIKFFDKNGATSDHRLSAIIAGSNHLSFNNRA